MPPIQRTSQSNSHLSEQLNDKDLTSLSEPLQTSDEENKSLHNYGYVKGQIVSVEENPLGNGKYLYMVRPSINGLYKKPIRVATSVILKIGRNYHLKGYLDTVIRDKRLIPYLSITRIKKTRNNRENISKVGRVNDRIKQSCFFALTSLTVKSIKPVGNNSFYIILNKTVDLGYRINILKLNCLSTKNTKLLSTLKEGDILDNVILAMYINNERDNVHFNEKSLRIIEFNIPEEKLNKLIQHIDKRF